MDADVESLGKLLRQNCAKTIARRGRSQRHKLPSQFFNSVPIEMFRSDIWPQILRELNITGT